LIKKKIIPVFLILIILLLGFLFLGQKHRANLVLKGEVEGATYSHIAEVSGKIVETNLQLGKRVKAGDLIARIDNTDQKYTLEQMQIQLDEKRLTLKSLLNGVKIEDMEKARSDIRIAEANYHSAEAAYNQAKHDTEVTSGLMEFGGIARNDLERAKLTESIAAATLRTAKGQLDKANAQLSLLQKGTDAETINLAEDAIKEMESKIKQLQEMLNKYEIRAICDGIIFNVNYNLGSIVNPGYNIADISADHEKYVICYVPENDIAQITYDQVFSVKSGKEEYQGKVCFINVKSQYTPKDMQTSAMRNKVSVKIKLLLSADATFTPGTKVKVYLQRIKS